MGIDNYEASPRSTKHPGDEVHLPSPDLRAIRRLSRVLDTAFRLPGTDFRFGVEPLLGLIPGIGDAVGSLLSTYILLQASHLGVSRRVLIRMLGNILIDAIIGSVPLVGDLFDAGFKANIRNMQLLESELSRSPRRRAARSARQATRTLAILIVVIAIVAAVLGVLLFVGLLNLVRSGI